MKAILFLATLLSSAPALAQNPIQCASAFRIWPGYTFHYSAEKEARLLIDGQEPKPLQCSGDLNKLPLKQKISCSSSHYQVELEGDSAQVYGIGKAGKEHIRALDCFEIKPTPSARKSQSLDALVAQQTDPREIIRAVGSEKWEVVVEPFNRKNIPAGMSYEHYVTNVRRFQEHECVFRTSEFVIKVGYCMDTAWKKFHQHDITIYGKGVQLFYRVAGPTENEFDPATATEADLASFNDVATYLTASPLFPARDYKAMGKDEIIDILREVDHPIYAPFEDKIIFSVGARQGMKSALCRERDTENFMSNEEVLCPTTIASSAEGILQVSTKLDENSLGVVKAYVEATVRAYTEAGLEVKEGWGK